MKLGAKRVTIAAVSGVSLRTVAGDAVIARALVVGIPKPCIASEHKNSRIEERRTARPSPIRE